MVAIMCGVAAIVGHVRPIYLGFGKGGKGVATAAGVFLALAPVQTLLALIVFAVVLLSSGYVSLGSLTQRADAARAAGDHRRRAIAVFAVSVVVAAVRVLDASREHRPAAQRRGASLRKARRRREAPGRDVAISLVIVLAVLIAARFA